MLSYSLFDKAIIHIDNIFRGSCNNSANNNPANAVQNTETLNVTEQKQSISMMRINHSGEICAQALYQGQALTARSPMQYQSLMQAASEENDHLNWCKQRLTELNGRPSLLNPVWYAGSFGIGVVAGLAGDQISLGFLAETEYQVTEHLEKHLATMTTKDQKSRAILKQMRTDELHHATKATQAGGLNLPLPIRLIMRCTAKVLTLTASKI